MNPLRTLVVASGRGADMWSFASRDREAGSARGTGRLSGLPAVFLYAARLGKPRGSVRNRAGPSPATIAERAPMSASRSPYASPAQQRVLHPLDERDAVLLTLCQSIARLGAGAPGTRTHDRPRRSGCPRGLPLASRISRRRSSPRPCHDFLLTSAHDRDGSSRGSPPGPTCRDRRAARPPPPASGRVTAPNPSSVATR